MDLKQIGIDTMNLVDQAQDGGYWRALVNAALNLRVPETMEVVSQLISQHKKQYTLNLKIITQEIYGIVRRWQVCSLVMIFNVFLYYFIRYRKSVYSLVVLPPVVV